MKGRFKPMPKTNPDIVEIGGVRRFTDGTRIPIVGESVSVDGQGTHSFIVRTVNESNRTATVQAVDSKGKDLSTGPNQYHFSNLRPTS